MYRVVVSLLIAMPSAVCAMSSQDALDEILKISLCPEADMTTARTDKLREMLLYVSDSDINSIDKELAFFSSLAVAMPSMPLTCAADAGNFTACRILIAHKADINKADNNRTPLKYATNPDMITFLREMGATGKSGRDT
jgi:hypothetical protein